MPRNPAAAKLKTRRPSAINMLLAQPARLKDAKFVMRLAQTAPTGILREQLVVSKKKARQRSADKANQIIVHRMIVRVVERELQKRNEG